MGWTNKHRMGLIPDILLQNDRKPVAEQLNLRYAHGGGYFPFSNKAEFSLNPNRLRPGQATLTYACADGVLEDFREWGRCWFPHSRELAILFDGAIMAIVAEDDSWQLTRVD